MFKEFRDKCDEIYRLGPAHFMSAPGSAWWSCLKNTKVKLKLITDYNMLMMVENGIGGGICQATYRYAKANNNYMNNYDKNIESSSITFLDANNLYRWA